MDFALPAPPGPEPTKAMPYANKFVLRNRGGGGLGGVPLTLGGVGGANAFLNIVLTRSAAKRQNTLYVEVSC